MKYRKYPMGIYKSKPEVSTTPELTDEIPRVGTHVPHVILGILFALTLVWTIGAEWPEPVYAASVEPDYPLTFECARNCWSYDPAELIESMPDGKGGTDVITARVTKYSRKDSCHNPRGNECLTAAGRDTKEGVTVACPYGMKLGTKVEIGGHIYTCEDRTAKWVQEKRGATFDIFTEDYNEAVQWGVKKMEVTVL